MDRALYVAMTGATQTLRAQEVNHHNLANASTTGFRAEIAAQSALAIQGDGLPTRVNTLVGGLGWDDRVGAFQQTGNALDIALGEGNWLAVQGKDGQEAFTRAGDLSLTSVGQLVTRSGQPVLGEGRPISIPPNASLTIGSDGTISIVPQGQGPEVQAQVGRLRVVKGSPETLERGLDGLMYAREGVVPEPAAGEVLTGGALETSNVNPTEALVNMISLSRQFEMQVRMMRAINENAQSSQSLLRTR